VPHQQVVECPDLFWRHDYFSHCLGGIVVSAEEAVDEVRRVLALERRRSTIGRASQRVAALRRRWCSRGISGGCPPPMDARSGVDLPSGHPRVALRRAHHRQPPAAAPDRRKFVGQHQQPSGIIQKPRTGKSRARPA
jgi:hypothetical protein